MNIAEQDLVRADKAAKAAELAKVAHAAAPKAPAKPKATKDATSTDGAPAPTAWQKHSVRGFISTLGNKHGYTVVSARRADDKARVYSIGK